LSAHALAASLAPEKMPEASLIGGRDRVVRPLGKGGNAQVYDAPPQVDYFPYAGGAT